MKNEKTKIEEKVTIYNTTNSKLPSSYITAIFIDGSEVWVGTSDGLAIYDSGRWISLENTPQGWISFITRINDTIWVAARGNASGLWEYNGNEWRRYKPPENFSESKLNMFKHSGDILIAKYDGKEYIWTITDLMLLKFNVKNKTWEFAADFMLHEDKPTDIEFCDDFIIISTEYSGIFIYSAKSKSFVKRLREVPGYPAIFLYPVYDVEIRNDKVYLAHDGRVSVYSPLKDCNIILDKSRWQVVKSTVVDPLSKVNLSNSFIVGKYIIKGNKAFELNFSRIFKEKSHQTVAKMQNKTIWIGTWGNGLLRLLTS